MYKGTNSSIVELLEKKTFTIHRKNIKKPAIEICNEKHKIAPKLICELFQETEHSYSMSWSLKKRVFGSGGWTKHNVDF